jgi:hypothetical protein
MGTYRVDWDCCGSVSETESWEPEHCPFCAGQKLRAEIEQLKQDLHFANGVADLAMKHRDEAEARVEQLRAALMEIAESQSVVKDGLWREAPLRNRWQMFDIAIRALKEER